MTTANTTGSKLASLNAAFAEADANQGFGSLGVWPNEPNSKEYILQLRGMSVNEDAKFRYKPTGPNVAKDAKLIEREALEVQFLYTYSDPDTGVEMEFKGSPLVIPYNDKSLPDNQVTRVRMARERLKGSLKGLLPEQFIENDLAANIESAKALLAGAAENSSYVQVKVFLEFREQRDKKGFFNKEEFIRELIAA